MRRFGFGWVVVLGCVVSGCGFSPLYEGQTSESRVVDALQLEAPGQRRVAVGTFGTQVPTPQPFRHLDPSQFPKGGLPLKQIELNVFGPKSLDFKQDAARLKIAINYPNLHVCGLEIGASPTLVGTDAQWKTFKAEFHMHPVSPSNWGTKAWEISAPTMKIVKASGRSHIEIRLSGPMLYVSYLGLKTLSGRTWRAAVEDIFPQDKSAAFSMTPISCPAQP